MNDISIAGAVSVREGKGGLPLVHIHTEAADAEVYLYGAHVASFTPRGGKDIFWMSPTSAFEEGKPVRGGIPICFPWFGPHPAEASFPQHGLARLRSWTPEYSAQLSDGRVRVALSLSSDAATRVFWAHDFKLECILTIGASFEMELVCSNTGKEPFSYSDCLHTYFAVSDVARVGIRGLEGLAYLDRARADAPTLQSGEAKLSGETVNAFTRAPDRLEIVDPVMGRTIAVEKEGFAGAVVWNAWEPKALGIADIGAAWRGYLCVESGNVISESVTLLPGTSHRSAVRYSAR